MSEIRITKVTTKPSYSVYNRTSSSGRRGTRIFFDPEGETIAENLFSGRHNRPYKLLQKEIPTALASLKMVVPITAKFRWSQKAGCSFCPCSPGFVSSEHLQLTGDFHIVDIFVTYTLVD